MHKKIQRWLFFTCWFLLATMLQAATWYVKTNGNDSASGSDWGNAWLTISNGVGNASVVAPATVLVSNGIYKLIAQISIAKGITVKSLNGRDVTFVDGNYPAATNRCFSINHASAVLDGFTITNGAANQNGGGVNLSAGTVQNCTISGNRTTNSVGNGGGVILNGGLLSNCTISGNSVDWNGSGIYMNSVNSLISNCIISNNSGGARGAAVYCASGTMQDSTIINNISSNTGGGVCFWGTGLFSNCTIIGNTCLEGSGGGIYQYDGVGIIQNCAITSNSATLGGGISILRPALLIVNCRINGNRATSNQGGGVYSGTGAGEILRNCMIDGNMAMNGHGGGLCVNDCTVQNCTIVNNSARLDPGYVGGGMRSANAGTVVLNTIIYNNYAGDAGTSNYTVYIPPITFSNSCFAPALTGSSTNLSASNIVSNPIFVNMPADCRLLRDSPCINRGANAAWMTNAVDLDARARIRMGVADMGAYEWFPKGSVFSGK